jgi:hypothetical protein
VGWGIEGLQIDPFDSNHLLWGTGLTLYGTHNLLQWDTVHSIQVSSLSVGVEEVNWTLSMNQRGLFSLHWHRRLPSSDWCPLQLAPILFLQSGTSVDGRTHTWTRLL